MKITLKKHLAIGKQGETVDANKSLAMGLIRKGWAEKPKAKKKQAKEPVQTKEEKVDYDTK